MTCPHHTVAIITQISVLFAAQPSSYGQESEPRAAPRTEIGARSLVVGSAKHRGTQERRGTYSPIARMFSASRKGLLRGARIKETRQSYPD